MENLKKVILEVLNKHSETAKHGSDGEYHNITVIDSEDFNVIADEIVNLIKSCVDPENQPNQYSVDLLRDERDRIWNQLFKVLPQNDNGDLEQGDEVYHVVYNEKTPKKLGDIYKKSFEESVEFVIKYIAENHHPHTMIQINSTQAILWAIQKNI